MFRFAFEELSLSIFTKFNKRPDTGSMSLPGIFCERQDPAPCYLVGVALVDPLKFAVEVGGLDLLSAEGEHLGPDLCQKIPRHNQNSLYDILQHSL
jgi:hypothetical protein